MKTSTVNISFQTELLGLIDEVAREESRSRSELIREAARMYIGRKQRWKAIFAFGDRQAAQSAIREDDAEREIQAYRKAKGPRKP
jgi:CopG family transcriptional regulator / antitoxin EndoAI